MKTLTAFLRSPLDTGLKGHVLLAAIVVLTVLLLLAAPIPASATGAPLQDPDQVAEQESEGEQEGAEGEEADGPIDLDELFDPDSLPAVDMSTTDEQEAALRLVEEILEEQQLLLSGQNFVYRAGARRDPFRSLLAIRQRELSAPEMRPPGLPGFLVNEVQVTAIASYQGRWQALITGLDGRTYFLEVGTVLYDGRVVEISGSEVVFEQDVEDLLGARSTRQVIKSMSDVNVAAGNQE